MTQCLDSWAVLRWLEGREPAATRIGDLVEQRPLMSWINLGEVFYVLYRLAGPERAHDALRDLRSRLDLDPASSARTIEAAKVKALHSIAFADAFAIATAAAHGAVLLTGDPEILALRQLCEMEDLR